MKKLFNTLFIMLFLTIGFGTIFLLDIDTKFEQPKLSLPDWSISFSRNENIQDIGLLGVQVPPDFFLDKMPYLVGISTAPLQPTIRAYRF